MLVDNSQLPGLTVLSICELGVLSEGGSFGKSENTSDSVTHGTGLY
jgi:hypothetical protein